MIHFDFIILLMMGEFNLPCRDPQATRRVLSAHDVNRSGSKRNACPRPVASSSYPLH